jgi:hypothetical protein
VEQLEHLRPHTLVPFQGVQETASLSLMLTYQDHFALILNKHASQIAKLIVQFTVGCIICAWDNNNCEPEPDHRGDCSVPLLPRLPQLQLHVPRGACMVVLA